jgi:hypothetical protein
MRGIRKKTAEQLNDENFRRQIQTFEAKGDKLRENFGADVFVLVRRKGRVRVYTSRQSLGDPEWPLRREEIAKHYPLPMIKTPVTFQRSEKEAKLTLSTFLAKNGGTRQEGLSSCE